MTAVAVECAERDALNTKHAARIPPACKVLPRAIETRANILRFVVVGGFTDSAFEPTSRVFARSILPRGVQLQPAVRLELCRDQWDASIESATHPPQRRTQRKSPSDGQGRVAHRRGSRFYTTILRVVIGIKHRGFWEVASCEKMFADFDKSKAEVREVKVCKCRIFDGSETETGKDSRVPKPNHCDGESAWLRLQTSESVIRN